MERLLIFSDTHGNPLKAMDIFDTIIGVTGVIHLGDVVVDAEKIENYIYPVPVYCVAGNNDFSSPLPTSKIIKIGGKTFFISHGHQFVRYNNIDTLKKEAMEKKADIALFGHTHVAYYEKENGIIYANPGSLTYPRLSERSYGIVEIDNGKLRYSNIFI